MDVVGLGGARDRQAEHQSEKGNPQEQGVQARGCEGVHEHMGKSSTRRETGA